MEPFGEIGVEQSRIETLPYRASDKTAVVEFLCSR
jgi:hypothetical protein